MPNFINAANFRAHEPKNFKLESWNNPTTTYANTSFPYSTAGTPGDKTSTAASPVTSTGGEIIFDSTVGQKNIKYWDGTAWITLMGAGAGATYTLSAAATNESTPTILKLDGSTGTDSEVTFTGSTNEIAVSSTYTSATQSTVNIGLPDDVTIGNKLTIAASGNTGDALIVYGDMTVTGNTTTVNTQTISLADNIITLNSDFTSGSPSQNAGIEVLRGSSATVSLLWNESTDKWTFTNDGSTYHNIPISSEGTIKCFMAIEDEAGTAKTATNASNKLKITGGANLATTVSQAGATVTMDVAHVAPTLGTTASSTLDTPFTTSSTHDLTTGDKTIESTNVFFDAAGHRIKNIRETVTFSQINLSAYVNSDDFKIMKSIDTNGTTVLGTTTASSVGDTFEIQRLNTSLNIEHATNGAMKLGAAVDARICKIAGNSISGSAPHSVEINHALNSYNLVVEVLEQQGTAGAPKYMPVIVDWQTIDDGGNNSANHIVVTFGAKPVGTDYLVTILAGIGEPTEITPNYL